MRLSKIVVVVSSIASLTMFAHAQESRNAWNFPDFTATQVYQSPKGLMPMKVYRSGSSVRVDMTHTRARLYVPLSNKEYDLTVYPDGTHQCVVMKPDQSGMLPSPLALLFGTKVTRTPAGTEVIEGHNCKIENVVVTRPSGQTIESKVWEAEDLKGIPVKIESQLPDLNLIALYRHIVLGAPDKELLTPPGKCILYEKMWQVAKPKVNK